MDKPSETPVIEGHGSDLALWQLPVTNSGILSTQFIEYKPKAQIINSSAIEFYISGAGSNYLDLHATRAKITMKITKTNGDSLEANDFPAPTNLPHSTIFGQVDLALQQRPLTSISPPNYAMNAYVETLLTSSEQVKNTTLETLGYVKDTAASMDSTILPPGEDDLDPITGNLGLLKRYTYVSNSREFTTEGPICLDFFTCKRLMINGVSIGLKFHQNTDSFRIMASRDDYKLQIVDMSLFIKTVTVAPEVILAHDDILQKTPALYPYVKTDIRTFTLAMGSYSFVTDDVFQGLVPSKIYVCFVKAESYNGATHLNPLNFMALDLNYLGFYVDGKIIGTEPFRPDYANRNYTSSYLSTTRSNGLQGENISNGITLFDFAHGYAIYCIDIGQSGSETDPLIRTGHTRLTAKFVKALEYSVNMVILAKFPASVKVDKARSVVV